MGDMQGKSIAEWKGPMPANMESAAALAMRADRWWKNSITRYVSSLAHRRQSSQRTGGGKEVAASDAEANGKEPAYILVVSHGGLIRVLLQGLLGARKIVCDEGVELDGRMRCPNASVTVIEVEKDGHGTLMAFADTTHLDLELVENNVDVVEDNDNATRARHN